VAYSSLLVAGIGKPPATGSGLTARLGSLFYKLLMRVADNNARILGKITPILANFKEFSRNFSPLS
jgi:hypothetical protein